MTLKFRLLIVLLFSVNSTNASEFIVRFKSADRSLQNLQLLKDADVQILDQIPQLNTFVVESNSDSPALEKIRRSSEVAYLEKNGVVHLTDTKPNDSSYRNQWHHKNIRSEKAWDVSTGAQSVIVAVLDTGISLNHDDLKNNIWINEREIAGNGIDDDQNGYIDDVKGWDFANKDNNPEDDHSHGSHCAGLIGAQGNNQKGVAGMNWKIKLMALKFFTSTGAGSDADGAKSIVYAVDNGARIISASWGSDAPAKVLHDAIDYANRKGVLFVAAAGNAKRSVDRKKYYPSGFDLPNIVSVGASTPGNGLADFTNYGLISVHVAAPGYNIFSTSKGNSYVTMSGTSMATPIVSGVAALALAVKPDLSVRELRNTVLNAVVPVKYWKSKAATGGLIQGDAAVQQLTSGPQAWPKQMRIKIGSKLPMTAFSISKPIWSSANNTVATVDADGIVTARAEGTVQIIVLDDSGKSRTASVQVVR